MSGARCDLTVVFDLGGVLIDWDPRYLYRALLGTDEEIEAFLAEVDFAGWNHAMAAGQGTWADSVAGLVVHCCELAPSWFAMPGLGRDSTRDRDAEFAATATVAELRRRIAAAVEETCALVEEFLAGPTVTDHPFRDFMPGEDRTDGALVLHVL